MRRKNTIQYIILVILAGILTIAGEFALLHFWHNDYHTLLVSAAVLSLATLILLFTSYQYEMVFIYSLITVLLSTVLTGYRYWEIRYFSFSVTDYDIWLILLNFLVPTSICFISYLIQNNDTIHAYRSYVRNNRILFLVYYGIILGSIEFYFFDNTILTSSEHNLIPFYTIAGKIEDYIYESIPIKTLLVQLLAPVLLFVPLGLVLSLALTFLPMFLRMLVFLVIPIGIEAIQVLLQIDGINIDDCINAILGLLIGKLICLLIHGLFHLVKGRDYLDDSSSIGSGLHF